MSNGFNVERKAYDWRRYFVSPSNVPFPAENGERSHKEIAQRIINNNDELRRLYEKLKNRNDMPEYCKDYIIFLILYGYVDVYAEDGAEMVYYCSKSTKGEKNDDKGAEQYNYQAIDIWTQNIKGNPEKESVLDWIINERNLLRKSKEMEKTNDSFGRNLE